MSDIQPDPYIDHMAAEHNDEYADSTQGQGCHWCRECGACDMGLPGDCTCGDCTCESDCGHPWCGQDSSEPIFEPPLLRTAVPDGVLARGVSSTASWAGE